MSASSSTFRQWRLSLRPHDPKGAWDSHLQFNQPRGMLLRRLTNLQWLDRLIEWEVDS